ncbi:hypothetical protein CYMTET_55843 [Cymbomonas tetramitiformis]|uniref:EGF-like domain-containing protein n=1 Tax=Cymbomonas tetramitiformis TaxID=36881 RepID=A0AAE0BDA2_9CHLO|nr:hypothetical protein CYMTET_55843 [Cymbomonas tetramitiformis]
MASSAGVASSQVSVTSITAGSVAVSSTVFWILSQDPNGTVANEFLSIFTDSPKHIFADATTLSAFTAESVVKEMSGIIVSGNPTASDNSTLQTPSPAYNATLSPTVGDNSTLQTPSPANDTSISPQTACPAGYTGTMDTACIDLDGCAVKPCFPGVDCLDVAAPGVGFVCSDCPSGYWGSGVYCDLDACLQDPAPCSPLVSCSSTPGGFYSCSACPSGTVGDGSVCDDVDECARLDNGGCDPSTVCRNTLGGRTCGECPPGHRGSGYTQCLPTSTCDANNGGCDYRTGCLEDGAGATACGMCPLGYNGTGDVGCIDEDGCDFGDGAGEGCYPGVSCIDTVAPGTGHTCGRCPVGMEGDGFVCMENKCFDTNGGCDPRVTCESSLTNPGGRICGKCPAGYVDAYQDGTRCEEEDGCAAAPCFPGASCVDVPAPGTGAVCGECPAGYEPASTEQCVDVDECLEANGGCDNLTECDNLPGGWRCTDCPVGFLGTGETGCRPMQTCDVDNGGCHELTRCTAIATGVECGACPVGYEGTGYTTCVDTDGCSPMPCFPGVVCEDVPAPGVGYICAGCPEGYKGDGEVCEMCELDMAIVSSTAFLGKMKRAFQNQVVGELRGLRGGDCVPSLETIFAWSGTSSDAEVLALSNAENQANTLRLNFPAGSLTTFLSYTLVLRARVTARPEVNAEATLTFYVEPQQLVALVSPAGLQTGQDSLVVLNAADSYDPDEMPGELRFRWTCTTELAEEGGEAAGYCHTRDGLQLPPSWDGETLQLSLLGAAEGLVYNFRVLVSKGDREAEATTRIVITSGRLPVPAILPLLHKPNANDRLRLQSEVRSATCARHARCKERRKDHQPHLV